VQYLEEHPDASTLQIRSSLKITQTLLFLSLGWLSREGRVDLVYRDRGYWVTTKR
jgi:hypothetical protein